MGNKTIGFSQPYSQPDIIDSAAEASRQKKLAEQLKRQSDKRQTVEPWGVVADVVEALAGNKIMGDAADAEKEAAEKTKAFYDQAFGFSGSPKSINNGEYGTVSGDPLALAAALQNTSAESVQNPKPDWRLIAQLNPDYYARMLIDKQNETFGAPVETAEGKFIQAGNRGTVKAMDGFTIPKQYQQAQLGNRVGAFDPSTGQISNLGDSGAIGVSPNVSATLPVQWYNAETSRMNAGTDAQKLNLDRQKFKQEQEGDETPPLTKEGFGKVVDKVIAGEIELPKNTRTPYWQSVMEAAAQKDPTFNQADYATRLATKKGFTSGKQSDALNALNTVVGHMGKLDEAIEELNNFRFPIANKSWNKMSSGLGGTSVKKFETAVLPVAQELTRVYRGAGGSEKDIQETMRNLNINDSYDQQKEALKTLVGLLGSKIEALNTQYNQGMKTSKKGFELLTPESQAVLSKITGAQQENKPGTGGKIKFMGFE